MPAGDNQPAARPVGLVVRPLTSADTEDISSWQYDGPWRIYDSTPDGAITAESGFQAVADSATDALVGYICLGAEARIPGLGAEPGVLDVGAGMRPDLVGSRIGSEFGATVLGHIAAQAGEARLRAVVQSWNERSLRLCAGLGFQPVGTHTCVQDGQEVSYVVLTMGGQAAP